MLITFVLHVGFNRKAILQFTVQKFTR